VARSLRDHRAATGEVMGDIALVSGDWSTGVAEAMYWIAAAWTAWRGRGFSSAALRLLCEWGFRELGLRRIQLVTDPDNLPSRRTAEAAGFALDGRAPARKAGRQDLVLYSLLPPAKAR
jgi:RimJ/RimL family protein N-acetyltransferase